MNRYGNYLETGFEWIGKIPSSWELSRVGKFFTERSEKVDDVTYPPLSVTMNGIVDQLSDVAKSNDNGNRKLVKKDDFVINSRSDRKGSSGIAPRDGSVSLINIVLAPKNIDPKYIENLFKSYYFKEEYFRNGKGIHWDLWTTRWEQFKNINIPIPPIEEQKRISCYLDKKTSQIDSLVDKIQRKLELLKEQRTSLINHYVTKGLNRDIEMKDSGVNWIAQIPNHWSRGSLKQFTTLITDGAHISPDTSSEDQYFISTVDITDGVIDFENCLKTSQVTYDYLVKTGCKPIENDILFSKDGTIGKTSLVKDEDFVVASSLIIIRPNIQNFLPKYLEMVLQSHVVLDQIESMVRGAALRRVSLKNINSVGIMVPPLTEQQRIIEVLISKEEKIKNILEIEEKRLRLLSEYRKSLISSVVTGKVRVTEDMI